MTSLILLAALLPLPLPFSRIVPWWQIFIYEGLLLLLPLLSKGRRITLLSTSRVNLLALSSLLFFLVDLLFLSRHLIQVADHLTMALLLIKIFSMGDRKDFVQFLILTFFLFLSVMASATHVTILIYFLFILPLFLHILITWTQPPVRHTRGLIAGCMLFSLLLAIPLFTLMPRMRQTTLPGIGRGVNTPSTGLTRTISLGSISAMREDRRPVLRVKLPTKGVLKNSLRLRGLTFDYTDGKVWTQSRVVPVERIPSSAMPAIQADGMVIFIHPDLLPNLFLPYGIKRLHVPRTMSRYNDQTYRISKKIRTPFTYMCLSSPAISPLAGEDSPGSYLQVPLTGVDYHALARSLLTVREEDPSRLTRELLRVFHTRFRYSLHPTIPAGEDPTRYFLSVSRRGHCELFASSMVILLRAMKIPARVAGGFLGGDVNTMQGVVVVRQRNAHVWVEAWLKGQWEILDPTPPVGRPALNDTATSLFSNLTDTLNYLWDRYILPYGRFEQAKFLLKVRSYLLSHPRFLPTAGGACLFLLLLVLLLLWRPIPAHPIYRLLRWKTGRLFHHPAGSLAPMEVSENIALLLPEQGKRINLFFQHYTMSSFGKKHPLGNAWRGVILLLYLIRAGRSLPAPPHSSSPPHGPSE